jgi:hypothetical protein
MWMSDKISWIWMPNPDVVAGGEIDANCAKSEGTVGAEAEGDQASKETAAKGPSCSPPAMNN